MSKERDAFAAKVADALFARDMTAQRLGMTLEVVTMGAATLSMTVTEDMLNGHGVAHGGYIFTLADTAFAYACNGENVATLAQHCQITFVAPGKQDERLTATATELSKTGRSGLYDVEVRGGDGRLVAAFRGASRTVGGATDAGLGIVPSK
ncbi:MAG: hydroxyphenylacetyl-CoA thioesterase PaaI [Alphaproteobacteria bacterium]|jgi:acyl-CoA thioesterase|nr:hydroxyphenylacetyl-CoA thioesterase PaaI [Alphaproteobacteria bacterium]